jgi:hypothetical protein
VHTYVFTVKYDCAHVFTVKYDCAHICVYRQIRLCTVCDIQKSCFVSFPKNTFCALVTSTYALVFNTKILHDVYIYYSLLLHVSAMNFGHLQGARSFLDIYIVYGKLLHVNGRLYMHQCRTGIDKPNEPSQREKN